MRSRAILCDAAFFAIASIVGVRADLNSENLIRKTEGTTSERPEGVIERVARHEHESFSTWNSRPMQTTRGKTKSRSRR